MLFSQSYREILEQIQSIFLESYDDTLDQLNSIYNYKMVYLTKKSEYISQSFLTGLISLDKCVLPSRFCPTNLNLSIVEYLPTRRGATQDGKLLPWLQILD
jgi:hypothetical protein